MAESRKKIKKLECLDCGNRYPIGTDICPYCSKNLVLYSRVVLEDAPKEQTPFVDVKVTPEKPKREKKATIPKDPKKSPVRAEKPKKEKPASCKDAPSHSSEKKPSLSTLLAAMLVLLLIAGAFLLGKGVPIHPVPTENRVAVPATGAPQPTQPPVKITVPTEPTKPPLSREDRTLKNSSHFYVFGSDLSKDQIASITFVDSLPDVVSGAWDVSENGKGNVLAWVKKNGELYDLYIGAEGGVVAPVDSSPLFYGYTQLAEIRFQDCFDTSSVTDMSGMFSYCNALSELDLNSFDTSSVTDMSRMFAHCSSLTTLDISSFDTSSVKNMNSMFGNARSLQTLQLDRFDTSSVQSMSSMFTYCVELRRLDLSSFDTSAVTNMAAMFSECSSLTELNLSSFDTSSVSDMSVMFNECSALTKMDLSNFDTSSVTTMESMFRGCSSLTELDLKSFDTSKVTNWKNMFDGCRANVIW